jgi:hypothetical protein
LWSQCVYPAVLRISADINLFHQFFLLSMLHFHKSTGLASVL